MKHFDTLWDINKEGDGEAGDVRLCPFLVSILEMRRLTASVLVFARF